MFLGMTRHKAAWGSQQPRKGLLRIQTRHEDPAENSLKSHSALQASMRSLDCVCRFASEPVPFARDDRRLGQWSMRLGALHAFQDLGFAQGVVGSLGAGVNALHKIVSGGNAMALQPEQNI